MGSNPTLSATWRASYLANALRIGLVGLGKIARDQHLPAIAATEGVELVAIASRNAVLDDIPSFKSLDEMLGSKTGFDAVVLCQPPSARFDDARRALIAGKHVFLEKPPGATVSEVELLAKLAQSANVTLFGSWHSRFGAAVSAAKAWLADHRATAITINWKEDIRQWHPGQDWILKNDGFGVFDPGINALSILTEIIGEPVRVAEASLHLPTNRQAPIAADVTLMTASGTAIAAAFDFRQTGPQLWDIVIEAGANRLQLRQGGHMLTINDIDQHIAPTAEYPAMYRHFLKLTNDARSDIDITPLQLVADIFLTGRYVATDPFEF